MQWLLIVLVFIVLVVAAILAAKKSGGLRVGVFGGGGLYKLKPAGTPLHSHVVELDDDCNGESSFSESHVHRVERAKVRPSNSHVHDITKFTADV